MKQFEYILRLAIAPGYFEDEKIERMVEFCKAARIDDVMFHLNCEELNQAHISIEETRPWIAVIQKAGEALKSIGVTLSINPWITLLHTDRGRPLNAGLTFTTMTDPDGNRASAAACPLDSGFRSYLTGMYAFYAQVRPRMLWVEDDFRLHNHAPLVWGGCFCENHMAEFSRRAGKTLTREEFVAGLLAPGEPHPYRKIWLDVARETMVSLAEEIGKAVHAVSPETQVGLMSSAPCVHCAEGRDWHGILHGLAGENPPVSRPHLPSYPDATPQIYSWGFSQHSRQTAALLPAGTEIFPELEGFPHTTFIKSNTFTEVQLTTSLLIGSDGITLNLFDMMGNGTRMADGYHRTLAEIKDFLSAVKGIRLTQKSPLGVRVMLDPRSSYTLHTAQGHSMEELYPDEGFFAGLLTAFGISNHYCTDKEIKGQILAISGQFLRNCTQEQIRQLFGENAILINGEAAAVLHELRLGQLANITGIRWHRQDTGTVCYEQVCDGNRYAGLPDARMSAQNSAGDFLEIEYSSTPQILSEARNYKGEVAAPGMTILKNRVMILPYGRGTGRPDAHLNPVRRDLIQSSIRQMSNTLAPMVLGCAQVGMLAWTGEGKTYLAMTNWSYDKTDNLSMLLQGVKFNQSRQLSTKGEAAIRLNHDPESGICQTGISLKSAETRIIILE